MKPRLIVICGPTGVGKSQVAEDVALKVDGEILSADSQQVYRGLDIGTGKPGSESRKKIRHHLIDIVDPHQEFNAAMFREMALRADRDVRSRGKNVILCGGTGLYIKVVLRGLFAGPGRVETFRRGFEKTLQEQSLGLLYERLRQADPTAAAFIHPRDRQRICRALEILSHTGKTISRWQDEHGFQESAFDSLKIGLYRDRQELYDRIDRRCEEMVTAGLVDEVSALWAQGHSLNLKPLQSIGYRHMGLFLSDKKSREEAVWLMKRDTRRLAKRQLTWFRSDPEIRWFHPDKERKEIAQAARSFLAIQRPI